MALTRGVDPTMLAAISAGAFHPVLMIYLDWPDAPVRMHSNPGMITFGGYNFTGIGHFASVEMPDEGRDLVPGEALMRLVAKTGDAFAYLYDTIHNRAGIVWLGVTTERAGTQLIGTPCEIFSGYMIGRPKLREVDGEGARIVERVLEVRIGAGPGARAVASLYHSPEDQAAAYPGDTAGRHLVRGPAEARTLRWPAD